MNEGSFSAVFEEMFCKHVPIVLFSPSCTMKEEGIVPGVRRQNDVRKKELLTAAICVTLTLFIIGIVVKGDNKQHPDVLHNNTEVEKSEMDEMQAHVHPYRVYIEQEKQLFALEQEDEEIETLELNDLEEEMGMAEEHMEDDVDDPTRETGHQQTERSTPPAQVNQSGSTDAPSQQGQKKSENNGGKSASENKDPPPADRDDENEDKPKDKDSPKPAAPENEKQEPEPEDVEESDPETEKDPDPEDGEEDDEEVEE